jgi:GPH family glycoside/pentoside/hexuronide:cation symporter
VPRFAVANRYAWPSLGFYMMRYLRSGQMKKFYADWLGVPLWWIAVTVALAVSLDALTDPLIGFLSDSCRWEFKGQAMRRRPFIMVGSCALVVVYLLLWSPCLFFADECGQRTPDVCDDTSSLSGSAPMYLLVLYVLYFATMGVTLIPYEALGAELTPGHKDRSNLMATYFVFNVVGILLAIMAPSLVEKESDTGLLQFACISCVVFASGAWAVASTFKERVPEEDNPPVVPSMLNCLRNPVFRVLLLNQLIESIGSATQFTVLPFVVSYVIDPEHELDGSPTPDATDEDTVYTLLGGGLLVFELLSIPFWLCLVHRIGKYKAYVIWNLVLSVTTGLKVLIGHHMIMEAAFFAILWGIGNGGATFIIRTILADIFEYDELITGERREGEFGVYIDFFGEKLPSIPGEVIPLMLMGSMGYVSNMHPQNDNVIWLLRLCFSIIPAVTGLIAIPVLVYLYPEAAKDDEKFLEEVHAGLARHRKGMDAVDPCTGCVLLPPKQVQALCDPYKIAASEAAAAAGAAGGGGANLGGVAIEMGSAEDGEHRGKKAMEAFDHFTQWELQKVVASGEKNTLVTIMGVHTLLSTLSITILAIWARVDWNNNIDVAQPPVATCTATSPTGVLLGDTGTDTACSSGFYGEACEFACPGLVAVGSPATTSYTGLPCSGFGTCNVSGLVLAGADVVAGCECDKDHQGVSCSEPVSLEEPVAMLPVIIALIGLSVFLLVISVIRLREAIRIQSAEQFNVGGRDVTVQAVVVRLQQINQPKAASPTNLVNVDERISTSDDLNSNTEAAAAADTTDAAADVAAVADSDTSKAQAQQQQQNPGP